MANMDMANLEYHDKIRQNSMYMKKLVIDILDVDRGQAIPGSGRTCGGEGCIPRLA